MSVESRTNLNANASPAFDALERRSLEQARQASGDTGIDQVELVAEGPQGPVIDDGERMLAARAWESEGSRNLPDSGFVSSGDMGQDLPDDTFGL